jgi:hypothetical protein
MLIDVIILNYENIESFKKFGEDITLWIISASRCGS